MTTTFKLSSLTKATFLFITLFMFSGGLKAQIATIINNTDCTIEVVLYGVDLSCGYCVHDGGTVISVAAYDTEVVNMSGNGCTIEDGVRAFVQGVGGSPVQVRTNNCVACSGNNILSATMTFPAGVCYAVATTATVSLNCAGSDIDIEVNP